MPEAAIWIEIGGQWEQCYARLGGSDDSPKLLRVWERIRPELPASVSNCASVVAHFDVEKGYCEVRATTVSMAQLSRLLKLKLVPPTPCFFNVKILDASRVQSTTYRFCSSSDEERSMWIHAMNRLCNDGKLSKSSSRGPLQRVKSSTGMPKILSSRPQALVSSPTQRNKERMSPRVKDSQELYEHEMKPEDLMSPNGVYDKMRVRTRGGKGRGGNNSSSGGAPSELDPDDLEEIEDAGTDELQPRLCGFTMPTAVHLLLCASAYPLALLLLVFKMTQSKNLQFLRNVWVVWIVNGSIAYALPIVLVDVVLQGFPRDQLVERLTVGLYCAALASVPCYLCFSKLVGGGLEEGTFSFKPSQSVRWTLANALQLGGMLFDWLLNVTMVLPLSVLGLFPTETLLSAVPPYLPFDAYFWTAFTLVFFCALALLLNAALRGTAQYRLRHSKAVWYLFNSVSGGGALFMTILILLLMSLQCNHLTGPRVKQLSLLADPHQLCYSNDHIMRARAGAVAVGMFFLQASLLPSATFKESLVEEQDISYLPVFLSLQCSLQLAAAYFFVFFYQEESARVVALSLLNCAQLVANHVLKPCTVRWVNNVRDVLLLHACLVSIHSLNLLGWGFGRTQQHSTAAYALSTLVTTALFVVLGGVASHLFRVRNAEYNVATAFLDIEYQVAHSSSSSAAHFGKGEAASGTVSPRALEPLIALTLSNNKDDWAVCKKYIKQLVFLLSYPSPSVQFQSAWALANIALLDEEARIRIHEAGGTNALQEGYTKMPFMAQLEVLAALANLTLSPSIADELAKQANCIPFFMELVKTQRQDRTMHCVFACIALGNLSRNEIFRDIIRRQGGIQALVRCIMSHNYQKRKYGMLALANMALSPLPEVKRLFQSWPGLLDLIVKAAGSNELDSQREVVALVRNLAAHSSLRPLLLDKGVMAAMHKLQNSPLDEVVRSVDELSQSIERELAATGVGRVVSGLEANEAAADAEALRRLSPLDARVDWQTWGSKLDPCFDSIFAQAPTPVDIFDATYPGEPALICLASSLTKATVSRWADTLSFVITRQPSHGTLTPAMSSHFWTYCSHSDYSGSDSFSFRVVMGSAMSSVAKCEVEVEPLVAYDDVYRARGRGGGGGGGRYQDEDERSFQLDSPGHEDDYFDDAGDEQPEVKDDRV